MWRFHGGIKSLHAEDYYDQGDKHVFSSFGFAILGLRKTYSSLFWSSPAHIATFELFVTSNRFWKQLSSRPHVSLFFCTHCTERKLFLYGSALSSCSLSYNKSSVLEAVSKKLAVTLQWSKHHPLWTSTKWCSHCLSLCSLVDSKCQTSAISKFNNWYNKSYDYPCFQFSVCFLLCTKLFGVFSVAKRWEISFVM